MLGRFGCHVECHVFLVWFVLKPRPQNHTLAERWAVKKPLLWVWLFVTTPICKMATGLSSSSVVVCSGSHVVWSWLNELHISIPFSPDISYEIERQYYQLRVTTTCTLPSGLVVNFTNMTYKRKRGE